MQTWPRHSSAYQLANTHCVFTIKFKLLTLATKSHPQASTACPAPSLYCLLLPPGTRLSGPPERVHQVRELLQVLFSVSGELASFCFHPNATPSTNASLVPAPIRSHPSLPCAHCRHLPLHTTLDCGDSCLLVRPENTTYNLINTSPVSAVRLRESRSSINVLLTGKVS